jgi:putative oxidoreductase
MIHFPFEFAVFVARVFLGILFFFQGYEKIFRLTVREVVDSFHEPAHSRHLPNWILYFGAYFTSYVELAGGFMLIIGFLKYYALFFLGFDLLFVAVAFSILRPMWDMQYVFPRLILLLLLLIVPSSYDILSADYLMTLGH